ncbi:MAG: hypothetical protein HUU01_22150 [Saprospiraceae bacterium]|nr:hypothetical protein [Saprospiraceae bacterium]
MKKHLLIDLLQHFERKEFRKFCDFVQSPFYNGREDLKILADYLYTCFWETHVLPDKVQIFKKLYGKIPYDDQKVRMAMSLLYRLAQRYLANSEWQLEALPEKVMLMRALRRRNLAHHFEHTLKGLAEGVGSPQQSADYQINSAALLSEIYHHNVVKERIGEMNLQAISDHIDRGFYIMKLRIACLALSHQAVYKADYDLGLLPEILTDINQKNRTTHPAVAAYYHCYLMLRYPEIPQHFQHFLLILFEEEEKFREDEIHDFYLMAINFCTQSYNKGNDAYLPDLLGLYRRGLEKGVLANGKHFSRFVYRNIVTLGLILKEYDWTEQFIVRYKDWIETAFRDSMYSFCMARLAYSRGDYDTSLLLLQKSEYEDLLLNLSAKTVLLKIFYELREYDSLEAHLNAMEKFLIRKKQMGYHRDNYLNIIRFTRKVLEATDKESLRRLQQEVEQTKNVAERQWLMTQLEAR